MVDKSNLRQSNSKYVGNQMFAGRGVQRSCDKCGQHHPTGKLKLKKPWGLCCESCRGIHAKNPKETPIV